ncbi:Alpha/Beta hydrolase protein [Xylariaceae sp. FL0255]|nr:Alpha/Beta hydrolase protein [Xylariaceae sp. FL0255]
MVDSLTPNDPRVEHKFKDVDGHTYHYMLAKPEGKPVATIFLIHGWPDLGMGWRFQVPFLLSLNLQVVVPDMLGYGQTSAPDSPEEYSMKKMNAHMAEIIKSVTDQPIILGGHDWGGIFVWRMAQSYPELIHSVFSICVPYAPPSPVKFTLEQLVERLPNFKYQLQLASGTAEEIVAKKPERLRAFINGMYGGTTPSGDRVFSTDNGVEESNIDSIGQSPLIAEEMIDFYVQEYSRHLPVALHGPCNWYRTRDINAIDEMEMAKPGNDGATFKFPMPAMLLMAEKDAALPVHMARGQEQYFAGGLKQGLIKDSSHWAMVQKPAEVNRFIGEFVKEVLGDEVKAAL